MSYIELCEAVLRQFVSEAELPTHILHDIVAARFPIQWLVLFDSCVSFSRFGAPETVTLQPVHVRGATVHVCNLWHGPTLAFKDLGLQVVPS